jgi:serine/threonine protein kinase
MAIARGLSNSPHVIRVFDAGYLKKSRSNYHILQLVEGDTLDHLIGIAGTEHASILSPKFGRSSKDEANREFLKSLSGSASEAWRRERKSPPFEAPPGLSHIMDLLTSTALWLEEVHHLGYAVNDLKNGNVMMSRRGQFKAIDLDSYSRIFSPLDKLSDFFFLAVSSLQLVTRGCGWEKSATASEIKELLADPGAVERRLLEIWPYGDLGAQSDGRISTGDVTGFFARFIDDARSGRFAEEPQCFTDAIDMLIYLKRRLSTEEMVLQ